MLLPEDIRAVPYWIDDSSLKSSIISSGASKLLEQAEGANKVINIPFDFLVFILSFFDSNVFDKNIFDLFFIISIFF